MSDKETRLRVDHAKLLQIVPRHRMPMNGCDICDLLDVIDTERKVKEQAEQDRDCYKKQRFTMFKIAKARRERLEAAKAALDAATERADAAEASYDACSERLAAAERGLHNVQEDWLLESQARTKSEQRLEQMRLAEHDLIGRLERAEAARARSITLSLEHATVLETGAKVYHGETNHRGTPLHVCPGRPTCVILAAIDEVERQKREMLHASTSE